MKRELINGFNNFGFLLIPDLLSKQELNEIVTNVATLPPRINLPDGRTPWGYGNLLDDPRFNFVLEKSKLTEVLDSVIGGDYGFNHLLINNKSRWTGPPVEWHQELSLVNTYAAGYTEEDVDKFAQIYIAIDEHTEENGCLSVFPGSHKQGLLQHEDIVGYNLNHKKQISQNELDNLNKYTPLRRISMNPGDCLVFSHLLVHGSGSNNSPFDRKAFIGQARKLTKPIDSSLFRSYSLSRLNFAIDFFDKKIQTLKNSGFYNDFLRNDKKSTK